MIIPPLNDSQALIDSSSLKQLVFDWMESGLIVLDQAGNISAINRQACSWAGIDDPAECTTKQPLSRVFPALAALISAEGTPLGERLEVFEPARNMLFGLRITPLPDRRGRLVIFSNITPFRKLESRIRQMERLAAVGQMAAGLAHEMKNPLAGIKAALQLLTKDDLTEEVATRLGNVILRDIDRLDGLLKNFLLFARPSVPAVVEINLHEGVEECLATLRVQYSEVAIEIDSALKGIVWLWDMNHFIQVVRNLLLNALQAASSSENPAVRVLFRTGRNEELLAIRDNGPGLPMERADRLFDPFYTTKPSGTGLGLPIAQRLAEQNASWIELLPLKSGGTEAVLHYQPRKVAVETAA